MNGSLYLMWDNKHQHRIAPCLPRNEGDAGRWDPWRHAPQQDFINIRNRCKDYTIEPSREFVIWREAGYQPQPSVCNLSWSRDWPWRGTLSCSPVRRWWYQLRLLVEVAGVCIGRAPVQSAYTVQLTHTSVSSVLLTADQGTTHSGTVNQWDSLQDSLQWNTEYLTSKCE